MHASASDLGTTLRGPTRAALGRRPLTAGGQGKLAGVLSLAIHAALLPVFLTTLTTSAPPAASVASSSGAVEWTLPAMPVERDASMARPRARGTADRSPAWEPPAEPAEPQVEVVLREVIAHDTRPVVDLGPEAVGDASSVRARGATPVEPVARVAPWPAMLRLSHRLVDELGIFSVAWADFTGDVAQRAAVMEQVRTQQTRVRSTAVTGSAFVEAQAVSDNPAPRYPGAARRRNWEGTVVLDVVVDADGSAMSVAVANGSGHGVLDRAAVAAVMGWRFTPARRHGAAIVGVTEVEVAFRLADLK